MSLHEASVSSDVFRRRRLCALYFLALVSLGALAYFTVRYVHARPRLIGRYAIPGSRGITDLVLAADGDNAYLACEDGVIRKLDFKNVAITTTKSPVKAIFSIAFWGPDQIVVGDRLGHLTRFDIKTGDTLSVVQAVRDAIIMQIVVTPDKRVVAATRGSGIVIWGTDRKEVQDLKGHQGTVLGLAVSPNGEVLASGGADNSVRTWDLTSLKPVWSWETNEQLVFAVRFVDDNTLLSGSHDGKMRAWNVTPQQLIAERDCGEPILDIAFSREASLVATGDINGFVRIWSWPQLDLKWTFEAHHDTPVTRLNFTNQGTQIVTCCDGITRKDKPRDGEVTVWQLP